MQHNHTQIKDFLLKKPKLHYRKAENKPQYSWQFKFGSKWIDYGEDRQKSIQCFEKAREYNHYKGKNRKGDTIKIDFRTLIETNLKTKYQRPVRKFDTANTMKEMNLDEKILKTEALTQWERCDTMKQFEEIKDEKCPICYCEFLDEDEELDHMSMFIVRTCKDKNHNKEGHWFHAACLAHCYQPHGHFLKCPCCVNRFGLEIGDMPEGTMTIVKEKAPIPSYPKSGTIHITYHFPNGIQGPEHQNTGLEYVGTSRAAFLPDNKEGNYVLELLKIGWERRLLFRVGQSVTTGTDNCVVWNGVHHKTNKVGGSASFGYPDVTYFARVIGELNDKGVTLPYEIEYEETKFD